MRNGIAVSIIVPVYNADKYLVKCLDSVVNQTLQNVEIILVDDGSTDQSSAICKSYAEKDERIIYFKKENEGLAAARQDGMERAHGEYVGFVDSDDWLELNMYERMYAVAKENDADVVFCNCYKDESSKNSYYLEPGVYDRERIEKEILPRSLAGISPKGINNVIRWCNWLRIYRLDLIKENGIAFGRGFRRSQDLQLTFETALYAQKYVSINDEYLYHNRDASNGNSLSRGYTKNYWNLIRPLIDKLYEDVAGYTKQDLSDQMHLCAFFFAICGIENEMNPLCPNDKATRIKLIEQVMNDPVCERFYGHIEVEKLNPLYQKYYELIHKKKAEEILDFTEKYKKKQAQRQKIKKKYIYPLLNVLTENAVYKKLRGKK